MLKNYNLYIQKKCYNIDSSESHGLAICCVCDIPTEKE